MFRTARLLLRSFGDADRAPFAALNADPEVMRHFPAPLTREESDAMVDRILAAHEAQGFGLWAVEAEGAFIGFIGLAVPGFEAAFTPCVEIGWRLARAAWGRGYATEGAGCVLARAFDTFGLERVLSFTALANERSWRVMERIGMRRIEDFDHPRLAPGHPLRRHRCYVKERPQYQP